MAVATYTSAGVKATTAAKLDQTVFGVAPENHELLKRVYTAYLANGRTNNAITKTRGLVSGGGKKPWKQKGTGRARFGSSRVPIWRGGGIVFGPTGEENYTKEINVKAKRLAIRQALSLAHEANKVIVVEDVVAKEGKTAEVASFLSKVGASRRILLVVENKSDGLVRATNNLGDVKLVQATYLNVYDVLNADSIVMTSAALAAVSAWLGGSAADAADKEGDK
ncbi:MAG TPA: 50S ribosomal protein L4 [Candidatus Saccharimonadales bacterium]|nr:50S ribosomal protein L4 [Candidatus Saccharimonadales bacterium]